MDETSESSSELSKTEPRRRKSIFNRRESIPFTMEVNDDEVKNLEEYQSKLLTEKNMWKELLHEAEARNKILTEKLNTNVINCVDKSILDKEDQDVIDSYPDYSEYLKRAHNLYKSNIILQNIMEKVKRIDNVNLINIEYHIEQVEAKIL